MIPPDEEPEGDAPARRRHLRPVSADEGEVPRWHRALAYTGEGQLKKAPGNAAIILQHHDAWDGVLVYDEFADDVRLGELPALGSIPDDWPSMARPAPGWLTDQHATYAGQWLEKSFLTTFPKQVVYDALVFAARAHPEHPLRVYLEAAAAAWDGEPRVGEWLVDYLGVTDTPYARRVGQWWLISAVARAFEPGCQVDHVLILEGVQGVGKNSALAALIGDEWYLAELPDVRDKDSMIALQGVWVACVDELHAMRAADNERVKSFFTRRIDRYRPPYARTTVRRARTTVFAATTNADQYLLDETGRRRYWPVRCRRVDVDAIHRDRTQLWGEAVELWREGHLWYPTPDQTGTIDEEQVARDVVDAWEGAIASHVHGVEWTTLGSVLSALGLEQADWRPAEQHRARRLLTRLGWVEQRMRADDGTRPRRWVPRGTPPW